MDNKYMGNLVEIWFLKKFYSVTSIEEIFCSVSPEEEIFCFVSSLEIQSRKCLQKSNLNEISIRVTSWGPTQTAVIIYRYKIAWIWKGTHYAMYIMCLYTISRNCWKQWMLRSLWNKLENSIGNVKLRSIMFTSVLFINYAYSY